MHCFYARSNQKTATIAKSTSKSLIQTTRFDRPLYTQQFLLIHFKTRYLIQSKTFMFHILAADFEEIEQLDLT